MSQELLFQDLKTFLASKPPKKLLEYLHTSFVPHLTDEDVKVIMSETTEFFKDSVGYRSGLFHGLTNLLIHNLFVAIAVLVALKDSPHQEEATKQLEKLTHLNIVRASNPFLELFALLAPHCSTLENLRIDETLSLSNLDFLKDLGASLITLNIGSCKKITDLSAVSHLTNLENLTLFELPKLTDLSPLKSLEKLENITLLELGDGLDLSVFADKKLSELTLGVDASTDLTALSKVSELGYLTLRNCEKLTSLDFVTSIKGLHTLWLNLIDEIKDFSFLEKLSELKKLNVGYQSHRPKKIDPSQWSPTVLGRLEFLDLYSVELKSLDFLKHCSSLKEFSAQLVKDQGVDWSVLTQIQKLEDGTFTLQGYKQVPEPVRSEIKKAQPNVWLGQDK